MKVNFSNTYWLKTVRRALGAMNQEDLGRETDLRVNTIYRIESGKSSPRLDTVQRILDGLEMRLYAKYNGEEFMSVWSRQTEDNRGVLQLNFSNRIWLPALRKALGVTQDRLARMSGIAQSSVINTERGVRTMYLSTVQRIFNAADITTHLQYTGTFFAQEWNDFLASKGLVADERDVPKPTEGKEKKRMFAI